MAFPQENSQPKRVDSKRAANDNTLRIEPRYPEGSGVLSLDARRPNRSVRALGVPAYDPYPEPEEDEYGFGMEDFPEPANDFVSPPPEQAMHASSSDRVVLERRLQTLSRNRMREPFPRAPVPPQKHYRVDRVMGAVMTLVALFFDLLAFLVALGALALLVMGVSELASKCGNTVDAVMNASTCLGIGVSVIAGGGAAFFIGPGIIAIVSTVAAFMAAVVFGVWFWLLRIPLLNSVKKIVNIIMGIVAEFVSVGILPGITISVMLTIIFSRREDKEKYKKALVKYELEKKEYDKKYARRIARARAEEVARQRALMELEQAI